MCVQYTVYCSIEELFKSDEDVKISTETEDVVGTEEQAVFFPGDVGTLSPGNYQKPQEISLKS